MEAKAMSVPTLFILINNLCKYKGLVSGHIAACLT